MVWCQVGVPGGCAWWWWCARSAPLLPQTTTHQPNTTPTHEPVPPSEQPLLFQAKKSQVYAMSMSPAGVVSHVFGEHVAGGSTCG